MWKNCVDTHKGVSN